MKNFVQFYFEGEKASKIKDGMKDDGVDDFVSFDEQVKVYFNGKYLNGNVYSIGNVNDGDLQIEIETDEQKIIMEFNYRNSDPYDLRGVWNFS